jgi:hypothetical protein
VARKRGSFLIVLVVVRSAGGQEIELDDEDEWTTGYRRQAPLASIGGLRTLKVLLRDPRHQSAESFTCLFDRMLFTFLEQSFVVR